MNDPVVGVKAYGWEWANDLGMSMADAAQTMRSQGINTVLAQNLIDPLPTSAVDQAPPLTGYDDYQWTQTLRENDLTVYQTTAFFFDPAEYAAHPELRGIDQWGREAEQFGWYRGINPTDPDYLERKIDKVCRAVETTKPDGLFLSFFRFPGFWELWLPDAPGFEGTKRRDIAEFGFDPRSLRAFADATGIEVGAKERGLAAQEILANHHAAWVAWKTGWLVEVAAQVKEAVESVHPGTTLMLNGFGLGEQDFGAASREVLGQDLTQLSEVIDVIELMFYFQIQKRDPLTWIPERIREARQMSGLPILADLQAGAEYLDAIYDPGRRQREITAEDWLRALQGVDLSGADGVLIYSWRDLLRDQAAGGERVRRLQQYASGTLPLVGA